MTTQKRFQICKIADIYNLPTLKQVQTACNELAEVIISARLKNDLAAEMLKAQGEEVPNGIVFQFPEQIEWIDDGKGQINMHIKNADGRDIWSTKWSVKQ